jgi:hypothetical protein
MDGGPESTARTLLTPDAPPKTTPPSSQFTIRIPKHRGSYANALKRAAEQTEDDEEEETNHSDEEKHTSMWPAKSPSGPIKGFSPSRALDNLDLLVRESWASQTQEAIFVHYLDGGYNPNIAQNVHIITEDLKSGSPQ